VRCRVGVKTVSARDPRHTISLYVQVICGINRLYRRRAAVVASVVALVKCHAIGFSISRRRWSHVRPTDCPTICLYCTKLIPTRGRSTTELAGTCAVKLCFCRSKTFQQQKLDLSADKGCSHGHRKGGERLLDPDIRDLAILGDR